MMDRSVGSQGPRALIGLTAGQDILHAAHHKILTMEINGKGCLGGDPGRQPLGMSHNREYSSLGQWVPALDMPGPRRGVRIGRSPITERRKTRTLPGHAEPQFLRVKVQGAALTPVRHAAVGKAKGVCSGNGSPPIEDGQKIYIHSLSPPSRDGLDPGIDIVIDHHYVTATEFEENPVALGSLATLPYRRLKPLTETLVR